MAGAHTGPRRRPLEGRVAIVTGAAQGLGRGIALRLAADGARVVCVDIVAPTATVEAVVAAQGEGAATPATIDVSDIGAVDALVDDVIARFGAIDVLVNNAAVIQPVVSVVDIDDATVERVIAVNLKGVIALSRAAGRHMRSRGAGRIINISSQLAKNPWPGLGVYAAAKAGVVALTQAMGLELAPHGVFVNAICPGTMDTEQARFTFQSQAARTGRSFDEILSEKTRAMPLGRLGAPGDAGAMVAWLASDDASFSVGATFNLTGGESVSF